MSLAEMSVAESFVDTFFHALAESPSKPCVSETHAGKAAFHPSEKPVSRLVHTTGAAMLTLVAKARTALRAAGVIPGDRVVLLANNSARWVAADLAMLAEGVISVPLYTRQAAAELSSMILDSTPRVVLVESAKQLQSVTLAAGTQILTLDRLFAATENLVRDRPKQRAAEDVVTLVYTSGTSGEAKGVMLTRRNVEAMLAETKRALEATLPGAQQHRVFHYLPCCFAGSRIVLWTCLFRGNGITLSTNLERLAAELPLADPDYYLNVPALLERIQRGVEAKLRERPKAIQKLWSEGKRAYDQVHAGRGTFKDKATLALAEQVVFSAIRKQIGRNLKFLICGSAPLSPETQTWFERLKIPVLQVYGLTETTAIVTMDVLGKAEPGKVGHAIACCSMRIGDHDELLVTGTNVFAGYWNKPEATREVLRDGVFHTGDQCEIDASGNLKIVGRVKNLLVPSSGHNVAPEPLEQKLAEAIPSATQLVVIGHARPFLTVLLMGEVSSADAQAGLDQVNQGLPFYKRIRAFSVSRELMTPESGQLTANQKLKRRAIEAHHKRAIDAMYAAADLRS